MYLFTFLSGQCLQAPGLWIIKGKMAKVKIKKKVAAKKDRPNRRTRQQYSLQMKYLAIAWKTKDNMSAKQIIA